MANEEPMWGQHFRKAEENVHKKQNAQREERKNYIKLGRNLLLCFFTAALTAAVLIVGIMISWPLAIAIGAAMLFGPLALFGVFLVLKHFVTDENGKLPANRNPIIAAICLLFFELDEHSEMTPDRGTLHKVWLVQWAFKISFMITALALAVLPLLIVTGVLPLSMLGIVSFGGVGAIAASMGFLVALPLLATVFLLVSQKQKSAEWFFNLIANHKTQILFWALATALAAVLFTLFLPPLALPGLTVPATLALIIIGTSVGIAVGELVTLKGFVNVLARWAFAFLSESADKTSAQKNTFYHVACTAGSITGDSTQSFEQILEGQWHFKGPFVVAGEAESAIDFTDDHSRHDSFSEPEH